MHYRPDIDGLRAIAVLAVVIFHLGVVGFDGGFIGVDVFFVISGYLITSNIMRRISADNFSLSGFYFRRIQRLIPALLATVLVTFLLCAWVMTPYDMMAFSRSAIASIFSLSNFVFFAEAGYWDSASELKPLLHTWSLGVEEQFYLFWPALILLLARPNRFKPGLIIVGLVSAACCLWYSSVDAPAAFYLLPFRVFQFAAGALVISTVAPLADSGMAGRLPTGIIFWTGLILVIGSVLVIDESFIFPGWVVFIPTAGSYLMLLAGALKAESNQTQPWLVSNKGMVWVGQISYAMYLVHWPIVALYRYEFGMDLTPSDQGILAVATLLATLALHHGVERRFYTSKHVQDVAIGRTKTSDGRFALATLLFAMTIAIAPLTAWQGDGWSWRYPSLVLSTEEIFEGKRDRYFFVKQACWIHYPAEHPACTDEGQTKTLVIGNSHEVDGYNFLRGAYPDKQEMSFVLFGDVNLCADFRLTDGKFQTSFENCQQRLDALFEPAKVAQFDIVLYSANRPFDANPTQLRLMQIIPALQAMNPELKVMTFGGYINNRLDCSRYVNETGSANTCALPENVTYFANQPASRQLYDQVNQMSDYFIDRVELLCKNRVLQTCMMQTEEGIPAFYDTYHMSRDFAEMTGRLYRQRHGNFITEVLAPPK